LLIAFDLRGHGQTSGSNSLDLSISNLCSDASELVALYRNDYPFLPLFLVGHSLGGSIATMIAGPTNALGIVVIDIVEEAAVAALLRMPQVLAARPTTFATEEEAVQWALRSRTCQRREVAEVSFLSQYRPSGNGLVQIVDLFPSEPHWGDWFKGLSDAFVNSFASRLLVLAETDYLDKTLLIGQMQGKFQLEIVRNTGHAIQEDQPKQLAALITTFISRNLHIYYLSHKS
jgi:protein phosphatase methylesterase 1